MSLKHFPAILAVALSTVACSGDSGPTVIEIPLASVQILEACSTIAEGQTCLMRARGMTSEGQIVTNAVLRWSSSNISVAQVNDEGRVFAVGVGRATITVAAAFGEGEDSRVLFVVLARPK
jgi:uncharacterized protein YjdB